MKKYKTPNNFKQLCSALSNYRTDALFLKKPEEAYYKTDNGYFNKVNTDDLLASAHEFIKNKSMDKHDKGFIYWELCQLYWLLWDFNKAKESIEIALELIDLDSYKSGPGKQWSILLERKIRISDCINWIDLETGEVLDEPDYE